MTREWSFTSYEEADRFVTRSGRTDVKIVSKHPLETCVPLEALTSYAPVFKSLERTRTESVCSPGRAGCFEYRRTGGPETEFQVAASGIAFLRPHLGIGGSARLALDAAMQLQSRGCRVRFFVPDPCTDPQFTEVTQGRVAINSVATWIPRAIGGRVRVPLTLLRTAMAARSLARSGGSLDLVFCDVVPHVIPLVKRLTGLPVLYFSLPGSAAHTAGLAALDELPAVSVAARRARN